MQCFPTAPFLKIAPDLLEQSSFCFYLLALLHMKMLISVEELKTKGCRDLIPLECEICHNTFHKSKSLVLRGLKGTRKVSVCGNECRKKSISQELKEYYTEPKKKQSKRNDLKKQLIDLLGGKCQFCGYSKSISALSFHHKNPTEKDFKIAKGLITKTIEELTDEVKKCMLVCSNCHCEIHDGLLCIDRQVDGVRG